MTTVKFLGHLISVEKAKVNPEKFKAICHVFRPTNKTEARHLMGMVKYLNKFSPRLAVFGFNIHSVAGAKAKWFWGSNQQSFFENIKREVSNTLVLRAF